ncbi:rhodanese-like domain-containing protein [Enterococcus pseudoavium]|uniref:Rhodanese-like domain-containing protein n=1 Tax=Enterococcus pseudoavium TaxID=44007 RepID=A0AAE4I3E2_9ENTE|nr:rhodanese-like domain-containing protein [Enterococcus pseudoavium]MDT2736991.1 rhodanese-like domain-containing protein [Enterococcus pseudoavium]MDT2755274.1 rhodanese-like domain-containing protein [Enterococcus pseudoavium]MDT2769776.1 rhodanese-like domain-containing protein [Enterococcus pseudoavium]REC32014.1 rhodanese-like domain-containing protein [Enterococcus pseudoavium]
MSIWWKINFVLITVIVLYGLYELYVRIMMKRSAKTITQEEFQAGMRKAQVIDVRERDEFNAKHILGARSFPYTMLKETYGSLRKDQPIYIYDHNKSISARAANLLRKKGYTDLYILKGGMQDWTGKVKQKKVD